MSEEITDKQLLFQGLSPDDVCKTAGESIHNEITYRGVDWIANTAFAVSFAYWANRTKMGQNLWSNRVQSIFHKALKPFIKSEQDLARSAELGTDFASIIVGGTTIIPPMTYLDKHTRPIAEWLDRRIYGDEEVDSNPRFAIRYDAIESRPEKDFSTGMAARGIVLAPMLAAHMNKHSFPVLNKYMYQPTSLVSRGMARAARWKPESMLKEGIVNKEGKFVSNWDYLHNSFGFDTSLTFIYSFAHEGVYKGLTNLFKGDNTDTIDSAAPSAKVSAQSVKAEEAQTIVPTQDAQNMQASRG